MSCLSWRPATGACVTVLSTRLANGALRRRHRVLLERGSTAVLGERATQKARSRGYSPCRARRSTRFGTELALRSRRPTSRRARCLRLGFPVHAVRPRPLVPVGNGVLQDRKSTRLNSSHSSISYAVFCLK